MPLMSLHQKVRKPLFRFSACLSLLRRTSKKARKLTTLYYWLKEMTVFLCLYMSSSFLSSVRFGFNTCASVWRTGGRGCERSCSCRQTGSFRFFFRVVVPVLLVVWLLLVGTLIPVWSPSLSLSCCDKRCGAAVPVVAVATFAGPELAFVALCGYYRCAAFGLGGLRYSVGLVVGFLQVSLPPLNVVRVAFVCVVLVRVPPCWCAGAYVVCIFAIQRSRIVVAYWTTVIVFLRSVFASRVCGDMATNVEEENILVKITENIPPYGFNICIASQHFW